MIKFFLILLLIPFADTTKVGLELSRAEKYFSENNPDSCNIAANNALQLAIQIEDRGLQGKAEYQLGKSYVLQGDYSSSMQHFLEAENLFIEVNDSTGLALTNLQLGLIEYTQSSFTDALPYFNAAYSISDKTGNKKLASTSCYLIGRIYLETNQLQKAEILLNLAIRIKKEMGNLQGYYECLGALGELNYKRGNYEESKKLFIESLNYFIKSENSIGSAVSHYGLANTYYKTQLKDSALLHYDLSYKLSMESNYTVGILKSIKSLSEFYKNENEFEKAYTYSEQYHNIHDSIFNIDNARKLTKLQYQLSLTQKQLEIKDLSKKVERDKAFRIVMTTTTAFMIILSIVLYRNFRYKQKSNLELELTLNNLKNAQEQLIRSEKLASLGELTAGVAHELKNPLNFIINFSEASNDLIFDIENSSGELKTRSVGELKTNLEKIQFHGQRADSIITNMMMHARSASNKKSILNLRILVLETIDLSYQAMRASKMNFNCKINTSFSDEKIMVNVIQQEIGRIILNLLNNAYYATTKKVGTKGFEPEVNISLHKSDGKSILTIEDNGIGMDNEVLMHIYEPFYTTKPTGEGTGLGLSMSYDMIQSNGGTIVAESELGDLYEVYDNAAAGCLKRTGTGAERLNSQNDRWLFRFDITVSLALWLCLFSIFFLETCIASVQMNIISYVLDADNVGRAAMHGGPTNRAFIIVGMPCMASLLMALPELFARDV